MKAKRNLWYQISPVRLIVGGYLLIILLGTLLLALPVATTNREHTPVTDCLFTATSATCVTGLIQYDTATHWSTFGELVILGMIQIGGIGFMTVTIMVLLLAGRKIGIKQRFIMQDSISAPQLGGIVEMVKYIVTGTFCIESLGAVLLAIDFVPRFGWRKGVYYSIFHSISAFCNAGFDLMGDNTGKFSSLTGFSDNILVNLVICALIFIGGLGFFVWRDLANTRFRFKKLQLQSKMVLSISVGLVVLGMLVFFVLESGHAMFEGMSFGQRLLGSFFQSVSARTAGFNTTDLAAMTESGIMVMICLMLVGGSTGSTAGGIKTTTFWVLCVSVITTFRRKKNIEAFGRRMEEGITRTASCIFMTYLLLTVGAAIVISAIEQLPLLTVLFETVSAMATVGLTLGITPSLCTVSKLILIFMMFCGRVGSVTMLLALSSEKRQISSRLPLEKIQVG